MTPRALILFCLTLAFPALSSAQTSIEAEIQETIRANYAFATENLMDDLTETSVEGSLAFWSSGGLLQDVHRTDTPERYVFCNLVPKHIQVVPLGDGSAVAQFYVEGSYQPRNGTPVAHYLTRATQVFVMEEGEWRVRAAHFSPVLGGSGTHVTAVK
jgi:hypothetical protein